MSNAFKGKSTFCLPDTTGKAAFIELVVDDRFVTTAPEAMRGIASRVLLAAEFLSKFDLTGRFVLASTRGIMDSVLTIPEMRATCSELFDGESGVDGEPISLSMLPAGLSMVLYTGLVFATGMRLQLGRSDAIVSDCTEMLRGLPEDWIVLRFLWNKNKHDVVSNIFVYSKKDFHFLASYAVMENRFYDIKGTEFAVTSSIKEEFERKFSEKDLAKLVSECFDGTSRDKHPTGGDSDSTDNN